MPIIPERAGANDCSARHQKASYRLSGLAFCTVCDRAACPKCGKPDLTGKAVHCICGATFQAHTLFKPGSGAA